jgi:hypothetical protein
MGIDFRKLMLVYPFLKGSLQLGINKERVLKPLCDLSDPIGRDAQTLQANMNIGSLLNSSSTG